MAIPQEPTSLSNPIIIIISLLLTLTQSINAAQRVSCPINDPARGFYRLGQSRWYIKANTQFGGFSGIDEATKFCETKQLRLGAINDLTDSVYAGRELESLVFKLRHLRNTLFYLNARYDGERDTYVWKTSDAAIQYQNIHYVPPNELGRGQSQGGSNRTTCLVFGSPYPVSINPETKDIYGWSTSMIEWPCINNLVQVKGRRFKLGALCENVEPLCDLTLESSYDLDQNSYKGLYPLANRRFIISWEQMNQVEAAEFCMNYQLSLYSPTEGDQCLLPYIKDHWPDVTTTSFWTSVKYNKETQTLKHEDGTQTELKYLIKGVKSQDPGEEDTCTSMSYTNERNDSSSKCKCRWNMMVQAVTNCNLPAGVICQHNDFSSRMCLKTEEGRIAPEYVTPLGDPANKFFRSVRKQEYKRAVERCSEQKMELVKPGSELFQGSLVIDKLYSYDLQTYWVSNPDPAPPGIQGPEATRMPPSFSTGDCSVAIVEGKLSFPEAEFGKSKCVEKKFFLCEKKDISSI